MYLRKNIKHLSSKGEKYQANSDLFIAHSVTENNWIKYKSSISTYLCWSSIIRQQVNNLPVRKHSRTLPRKKNNPHDDKIQSTNRCGEKKKRNNKDTTHTPLILEREQKLQNVNKPGND